MKLSLTKDWEANSESCLLEKVGAEQEVLVCVGFRAKPYL